MCFICNEAGHYAIQYPWVQPPPEPSHPVEPAWPSELGDGRACPTQDANNSNLSCGGSATIAPPPEKTQADSWDHIPHIWDASGNGQDG